MSAASSSTWFAALARVVLDLDWGATWAVPVLLLLLLREIWGRLEHLRGCSRRAGHTMRAFVCAALSRR
jgi:hypothetical protein